MKALIIAALVLLAGCANTPTLSPEQFAAAAKVNGAAASCVSAAGLYGHGNGVVVNAEQATLASGKITIAADCTVTIEANQPAPAK